MANDLSHYTTQELEEELNKRKGDWIEIHLSSDMVTTCHGCPTVIEFQDTNENKYYFRLRHGYWYLQNETTDQQVGGNYACDGLDGCCNHEEMIKMLEEEKIRLIRKY